MRGASALRPLRSLCLRLILSLAAVAALYLAVDRWTVQIWDSRESLIVEVLDLGPEAPAPSSMGEAFLMLQRETRLRVLTGEDRGEELDIVTSRLEGSGVEPLPGRRYLLVTDVFEDGTVQYSIADAYRVPSLIAFSAAVCLLLVSLTGWTGFKALLGLSVSVSVLVWGMIPLMARGWPPVSLALAAVLVISTVTVLCVAPCSRDRSAALLGSLGGVSCGFLLGALMVHLWQLTGLSGEGAALLASTLPGIDMRGVLLASILVGAIGAVLDVGVSVTAAMAELADYDPDVSLRRLWLAGMNVGGEVLGSMINTLILAYLGSSLPMAILISSAGVDILGILNDPYIGQELLQSMAGTCGLLFTIPATAFFFVAQEAWGRRLASGQGGNDETMPDGGETE